MGKKEEITDIISDAAFRPVADGGIDKNMLLKFERATIKITKVDRKNKRVWGEHVMPQNIQTIISHTGHDVTLRTDTFPFCNDCGVSVKEPATEDGDKKALDRRDDEERNTLGDGTRIDEG